jgi:V/A-type H+/Na+-transporting ATPase subunit D
MAKVKYTKNELKKQKDALKRFERFLPTLTLKKQQLQMVIRQTEARLRKKTKQRDAYYEELFDWIDVFGERVGIEDIVKIKELQKETGNIAGVDIPVFDSITFEDSSYNLFEMPLWVDTGIEYIKKLIEIDEELTCLQEQIDRLSEELRITTQRVNLFEKVKIPETKENIRQITIYLGDQQTAAVVRGKIAKNKIKKV